MNLKEYNLIKKNKLSKDENIFAFFVAIIFNLLYNINIEY